MKKSIRLETQNLKPQQCPWRALLVLLSATLLGHSATTFAQTGSPALVPIAVSNFDDPAVGADGWRQVVESAPATDASFLPSGGNTGGGIVNSNGNFFVAPAKFLGNQARAYGGTLRFNLRQNKSSGYALTWHVRLHSGGMILGNRFPQNPPTIWTSFEFVLLENQGWVNRDAGRPATRDELVSVLSHLDAIWIRADYVGANNSVAELDNVMLMAQASGPLTPELMVHTYAGLTINGAVGSSYRIEFRNSLGNSDVWRKLTDVVLPKSPYLFIDTESPNKPMGFYRVVLNQ